MMALKALEKLSHVKTFYKNLSKLVPTWSAGKLKSLLMLAWRNTNMCLLRTPNVSSLRFSNFSSSRNCNVKQFNRITCSITNLEGTATVKDTGAFSAAQNFTVEMKEFEFNALNKTVAAPRESRIK